MATSTLYLQGSTDTVVDTTDKILFSNGTFNVPITTTEYNDSTHVATAADVNKSSTNTPNNVKFISQSGGTGGDSQADWGAGTEDLDQIQNSEATLQFNFSHPTAVALTDIKVFTYDGATPSVPIADLDVRMAEVGDTNWVQAEGLSNALVCNNKTANTSHDIYIAMSLSPQTIGDKTGKLRIQLAYS